MWVHPGVCQWGKGLRVDPLWIQMGPCPLWRCYVVSTTKSSQPTTDGSTEACTGTDRAHPTSYCAPAENHLVALWALEAWSPWPHYFLLLGLILSGIWQMFINGPNVNSCNVHVNYITCKCKFTQCKFIQVSQAVTHGVLHILLGLYPYPLSITCWFTMTTVNSGNIGCRDTEEVRSYFPLKSCTDTEAARNTEMTREKGTLELLRRSWRNGCCMSRAELLNREQETLYKWLYKNHPLVVPMTRQKWKSTF